jgi:hypothetical protein
MRNRLAHLKKDLKGGIILNLENFVEDLGKALDKFLIQLITDAGVRKLAFKVLAKNHIVGLSDIEYINTENENLIH